MRKHSRLPGSLASQNSQERGQMKGCQMTQGIRCSKKGTTPAPGHWDYDGYDGRIEESRVESRVGEISQIALTY